MNQLKNLEAWEALAAVAETGSLAAAAGVLECDVSSVSRKVSALEKALGREFVNRSERPMAVTEDGRTAAKSVQPILRAHKAFITKMMSDSGKMEGTIRLAAAGGLFHSMLIPMLRIFQSFYPNIDFDVTAGRMTRECLEGKIDVASVSGEVTEKDLVTLPRGRSVFIPVASPDYIAANGEPFVPEDLIHHTGFVYTGPVREPTTELVKDGESRPIKWRQRTQSTDILLIKKSVLDGLGIAVDLPLLHCANEIAEGKLKVILGGWHRPTIKAYAACSRTGWHTRRIRVFMQWYCDEFQKKFAETERVARGVLGDECRYYLD